MQKTKISGNYSTVLQFILCVGGVIVLGFVSGLLSGATAGYTSFVRPPLTPPDIVFSIVWPILYFMIGLSLFLAIEQYKNFKVDKITFRWFIILFACQLLLNLFWPFVFFSFQMPVIACIVIALIDGLTCALIVLSFKPLRASSLLLLPYILWLGFATYLNVFIAIMN